MLFHIPLQRELHIKTCNFSFQVSNSQPMLKCKTLGETQVDNHCKHNMLQTKSITFFQQVGHTKVMYIYLGFIMEKLTTHNKKKVPTTAAEIKLETTLLYFSS